MSFRRSTSAGAIFAVGLGLQVQHAVDAKAHVQVLLLRLDVDVGRAYLGGVFEQRLQQLDDRRVLERDIRAQRCAEVGLRLRQLGGQLEREGADLLRAPVQAVDARHQLRLADDREADLALEQPRQLVVGGEIGRIGETDAQRAGTLVEDDRAKAPRLRLGQDPDESGAERELLEVDVGDAHLPGQGTADLFFADEAAIDQRASQLVPARTLALERRVELLLADQLLADEKFAEADFFWWCHAAPEQWTVIRKLSVSTRASKARTGLASSVSSAPVNGEGPGRRDPVRPFAARARTR